MEIKHFKEQILDLSKKINEIRTYLNTEEATKNALIMPFLQVLGYNVFDPQEVVPEFTADVGIKKGEKVDYAVFNNKKLSIIIECKPFGTDLDKSYYINQLYRYFSVSDVSVAILTNGETYMFYTDIEEKNVMDQKPYMVFNMLNIQDQLISKLKMLSKTDFDANNISVSAKDLKFTKEIKSVLKKEFSSPTDNFTKFIISQVMPNKRKTPGLINTFSRLIKLAFIQLNNENVNTKLESMILDSPRDAFQNASEIEKGPVLPIVNVPLPDKEKLRNPIRKVGGFTLRKEIYLVKTWREMLRKLCHLMVINHNDIFMRLLELKPDCSTDPSNMRNPEKINNTDLYIDLNHSAESVTRLCKKMILLFEYELDEFSINEIKI